MRILLLTIGLVFALTSCKSDETETTGNDLGNPHKVVVNEVIQTVNYTYLFVKESGVDIWLAVPKMEAKVGDTYYHEDGMLMENFISKELNRTFEKIYFLDAVRTTSELPQKNATNNPHNSSMQNTTAHNKKPVIEKAEVNVTAVEGGITIQELYANKEKYNGKVVLIKGVVAKFSPQIMNKNWIHLQDGTEFEGEFDLTITSLAEVKKDDTITFEGTISLDKDFGFGYFYKVIMEEAVVK